MVIAMGSSNARRAKAKAKSMPCLPRVIRFLLGRDFRLTDVAGHVVKDILA
jgi:hypothetical protein